MSVDTTSLNLNVTGTTTREELQDDSYEDWYEYEISAPVPVALGQVDTGLNNLLVNTTNGVMGYTNVIVVGQGENRRVVVVPTTVGNSGPMITGSWGNMLMNTTVSFANDEGYDFTTQAGTVLDLVYILPKQIISGNIKGQENKAVAGEIEDNALAKQNPVYNDPYQGHERNAVEFGALFYNPVNALLLRIGGEGFQIINYGVVQEIREAFSETFNPGQPYQSEYNVWTLDYLLDIPNDIYNTTAGSLGLPISVRNSDEVQQALNLYRDDSGRLREALQGIGRHEYPSGIDMIPLYRINEETGQLMVDNQGNLIIDSYIIYNGIYNGEYN